MNYTEEQIQAIQSTGKNTQIIACAGSGKTQVIAERISWLLKQNPDLKPEEIVAFTYSRKAAASLQQRIERVVGADRTNGLYIGTIHSFCWNLLQEYCPEFEGFRILEGARNFHFLSRYSKFMGFNNTGYKKASFTLNKYQNRMASFLVDLQKGPVSDSETVYRSFQQYRQFMHKHKYLDYSMMIYEILEQTKTNESLLNYIRSVKYLIVDEYQDIDPVQEALVQCFADNGSRITVVGDDDQTIYRFRDSSPEYMIHFAQTHPETDSRNLNTNFRCPASVITAADRFISQNEERLPKSPVIPSTAGSEKIQIVECTDQDDELDRMAKVISAQRCINPTASTAILLRKRKWIPDIEAVLRSKGIPYHTVSADHFFSAEAYNLIDSTVKLFSNLEKASLWEIWKNHCTRQDFRKAYKLLRDSIYANGERRHVNLAEIVKEFLDEIGFFNKDPETEKANQAAFEGFSEILKDFEEIYSDCQFTYQITQLAYFLETDAAREYKFHTFTEEELPEHSVEIMTVHQSKGLEFDNVHIPFLQKKDFPLRFRNEKQILPTEANLEKPVDREELTIQHEEDERRLFYVGMTRTKKKLTLYYQTDSGEKSKFLYDLERQSPELLEYLD